MRRRAKRRLADALRIVGRILTLGVWRGSKAEQVTQAGEIIGRVGDALGESSARDDYGTPPDVPRGDP